MPSKMKRPWTLAEIEQLRALAEKGKLTSEISDALSRSYESVKSAAMRHGISLKQSHP
jgi:DNA-binding CsgD family transcriptional regulator